MRGQRFSASVESDVCGGDGICGNLCVDVLLLGEAMGFLM